MGSTGTARVWSSGSQTQVQPSVIENLFFDVVGFQLVANWNGSEGQQTGQEEDVLAENRAAQGGS